MINDRHGNDDPTPDGSNATPTKRDNTHALPKGRDPNKMTYQEIIEADRESKSKKNQRH